MDSAIVTEDERKQIYETNARRVFELKAWINGLRKLERAKGFEPSTPTLARSCSTPELRPRSMSGRVGAGRRR